MYLISSNFCFHSLSQKGIFLNVSNLFIVFMYIRAAKLFHKNLLASILRSTLHFFESTPTGRIINRFSKDIDSIETAIPDSFKIFMFCLMNIIHTFIILSYSTPVSLFLIVPISLLYIFIQVVHNNKMFSLKINI